MQRVRVGLTGLACVFLLVMLAAVFLRATGGDQAEPQRNQMAAAPANGTATAPPNEPLAQLGVAPGNAPPATGTPAATPPPKAAPRR